MEPMTTRPAAPFSAAPPDLRQAPTTLLRALRRHHELAFAALGAALAVGAYLCARWAADRPTLLPIPSIVTLLVPAVRLASFYGAGLHRVSWRYASTRDAVRLGVATLAGSAALLALGAVLPGLLPRVLLLEGVFYLLLTGLSRFGLRLVREFNLHRGVAARRVLVVGAGTAGNLLIRAMLDGTVRGYRPVGIVDDNPAKVGTLLHGVPVVGLGVDLPAAAKQLRADVVVIAVPSASARDYYRLVNAARAAGLAVKTTPDLQQILRGGRAVARLEDVRMEDLLQRRPVRNDLPEVRAFLAGRTVLVTGAAGSIGSELCRQVGEYDVARLVCLDNNETGLFRLENDLRERLPHLDVVPFLGDIRDRRRMSSLLSSYRPDIVFHAAAYKHVPMLQYHPLEAIRNNVGGTDLLSELAQREGVEAFVLISTDKAVNPTSVMGATKRIAERIVRARNLGGTTRFCAIRFGNVLGSNGSVVELFLRQIREGRPVTVTHPRIERYFMTIPEAVHLVLFAAAMEEGGETFILDMGQPVRIDRLARDIIAFAGLTPEVDVPIVYTGLRPGEKLYEELWTPREQPRATVHPGIMVAPGGEERPDLLQRDVRALLAAAERGDLDDSWERLLDLVPSFQGATNAQAVNPPSQHAVTTA
jgi:FlaA1/EpsC-like NDP-sugar epimerase